MSVRAYRTERVHFGCEGATLRGEIVLPLGPGPCPAVVLGHGFGSDHRAMLPVAYRLAREGVASLCFDFRGHGRSEGVCEGPMPQDVLAALAFLRRYPGIDASRVALVGHSLGAASVLLAAAMTPDPCAVVALEPPMDPPDIGPRLQAMVSAFSRRLGGWARRGVSVVEYPRQGLLPYVSWPAGVLAWTWMWLRGYRARVSWARFAEVWSKHKLRVAIAHMSPRPLLLVHCEGDRTTPYIASVDLWKHAPQPKELMLAPKGFHSLPLLPGRLRRSWMRWLVAALD